MKIAVEKWKWNLVVCLKNIIHVFALSVLAISVGREVWRNNSRIYSHNAAFKNC